MCICFWGRRYRFSKLISSIIGRWFIQSRQVLILKECHQPHSSLMQRVELYIWNWPVSGYIHTLVSSCYTSTKLPQSKELLDISIIKRPLCGCISWFTTSVRQHITGNKRKSKLHWAAKEQLKRVMLCMSTGLDVYKLRKDNNLLSLSRYTKLATLILYTFLFQYNATK